MSGDRLTDGSSQKRPALGDLTNRPLKRGSSLVLSDSDLKSGDGFGINVDIGDGDSRFAKKVYRGVENLVRQKCREIFGTENKDVAISMGSGTENFNLLDCNVSPNAVVSGNVVPTTSGSSKKDCSFGEELQDDKGRDIFDVVQVHSSDEGHVEKDISKLASMLRPEDPKFPGLERCTGLKGDKFANLNIGDDFLKSCSCPFCLKAAYIWSDLHYRDIKARIDTIKKSQKEASILAQKNQREKETCHGEGSSSNSKQLESDLNSQWVSFFQHMENMFAQDGDCLQASYSVLHGLRENCKVNLEKINEMPSEKQ